MKLRILISSALFLVGYLHASEQEQKTKEYSAQLTTFLEENDFKGINSTSISRTPLETAIYYGKSRELIREILDHGGKITEGACEITGFTERTDILEELMDHGFSAQWQNCKGATLLMIALSMGKKDMALTLLDKYGSNVNAQMETGETPLICAAQTYFSYPELIDKLMQNGAKINVQDSNGWSALMHAAMAGDIDVIHKLLSYAPDITLESQKDVPFELQSGKGHRILKKGSTAFDIAKFKTYKTIPTILKNHEKEIRNKEKAVRDFFAHQPMPPSVLSIINNYAHGCTLVSNSNGKSVGSQQSNCTIQ